MKSHVTEIPVRYPRTVAMMMAALAGAFLILVALPSFWPESFSQLNGVKIDTDPENMLREDEPVREFHHVMKRTMSLYDVIVVGIVNDKHPDGVFNVQSLTNIYTLAEFAKTLRGKVIGERDPAAGVVESDLISPSTVDSIEPGGMGVVKFQWLMPAPPQTDAEALAIRERARRLPFLEGTLISEDGQAIALYLPVTSKDLSYKIYAKLKEKIASLEGNDQYHITGLPVAEDTFGVEMFKQMAISAPLAMLVIFILLFAFFRKIALILAPMIIALVSVIVTMGLLIVTGNTIHIMSSMIPIFIMPISVLDSVHILSEFFDRFQRTRDREKTIMGVMRALFAPMLYTSLTSTAGFASLALTPIPPVQVFGIFVAIGVMAAWLFTIVFVPAYVMLLPQRTFTNFGMVHRDNEEPSPAGFFSVTAGIARHVTYAHARWVLALTAAAAAVAAYGISRIQINDNPTRWFEPAHPIRVADRVLNAHFGGTYMAYLALRAHEGDTSASAYPEELAGRARARAAAIEGDTPEAGIILESFLNAVNEASAGASNRNEILDHLERSVAAAKDAADGDLYYGWEAFALLIDEERQRDEVFKQPAMLEYIAGLQRYMAGLDVVGKSNSLADLVKTVHRELFEGAPEYLSIPETINAVAQCIITYEGSHRPQDLYHFVTPDYRQTSLWVQLKSGDNRDMSRVAAAVSRYMEENPPPVAVSADWFGLTYINVVWQEKMVSGMLRSFAGSFLVVLLMMIFMFRSGIWGLLSMIPLTITIGLIYGLIGLIGKDYDMPVAVLSSLTLGLAVDFAIHFLARARTVYEHDGNWPEASSHMFSEPARAITRNVVVISIGFLPLLLAPLVPYQTVGVLLAAILLVSGAGTLLILPAAIRYLEPALFPKTTRAAVINRCMTTLLAGLSAIGLVVANLHHLGPGIATGLGAAAAVVITASLVSCRGLYRAEKR